MPKALATLAKLNRPRPYAAYERKRLFTRLDELRRCPVIWIVGPPGAGKTTLAATYTGARKLDVLWYQLDSGDGDPASFFFYLRQALTKLVGRKRVPLPLLTPEYFLDLPGFARRWFRELFVRLPSPVMLVLDNYQEIPAESALHRMLATAAEEIPENANLIAMSRTDPPAEFARLQTGNRLAIVEWDQLRLTLEEARAIATGREALPEQQLRELHDYSDGWAAGFTLMHERLRRTGFVNRLGDALPRETVFDFFATQIFNDIPPDDRDTLIRTAFLPRCTGSMARQISGNAKAAQLLAYLHERHLFTDCRPGAGLTYQYHTLFRAFLLARAKDYYTPLALAQLRQRAAALLEEQGQVDDAVALYLEAEDYGATVRIILAYAESMITAGRSQALREWIVALPGETADHHPWLAYWTGVCVLPTDPAAARTIFERSCVLFGKSGAILGEIKAAVGIIDSYYLERADFAPLDPWIELIFDRIGQRPTFVSAADELAAVSSTMIATLYRQPLHAHLSVLAQRTRALIEQEVGVNQKVAAAAFLLNYYDWTGDTVGARELVGIIRPLLSHPELTPLRRASWELRLAIHYLIAGEFPMTLAALSVAMSIAQVNGFAMIEVNALLFETLLYLCEADAARAEAALLLAAARLNPARRLDLSLTTKFQGWLDLLKGNVDGAVRLGERSVEIAAQAGAPNLYSHSLVYLAHFYSEQQEYDKAHTMLENAFRCTSMERYPLYHFDAELIRADVRLSEGNRGGCETSLKTALALGARADYFNNFLWRPRMMERLCAVALDAGIETDYVKLLIMKRGLQPPAAYYGDWPWPMRVVTLGHFAVELNGQPLSFEGKVPKKQLDLLKAIVASGGREVNAEAICRALWPDAEADAADNVLAITLRRLCTLLKNNAFVIQQGGKLGLDPKRCWVDVWVLERLLDQAENLMRIPGGTGELETLADRMVEIYVEPFLGHEPEQGWMLLLRDRLQSRVLRVTLGLGQRLEQEGRYETAVALYRRALEQDNLAEELYRRLMRCHAKLGQRAEAMAAYRRCRELLSIVLSIQPSAETEKIFHSLGAE